LQAVKELSLSGLNGPAEDKRRMAKWKTKRQTAAQTGLALAAFAKKASNRWSPLSFPVWVNVLLEKLTQERSEKNRRTKYSINWHIVGPTNLNHHDS